MGTVWNRVTSLTLFYIGVGDFNQAAILKLCQLEALSERRTSSEGVKYPVDVQAICVSAYRIYLDL